MVWVGACCFFQFRFDSFYHTGGVVGGGLWLLEGKRVDILCFVHQSFVQFLNRSVGFVVEVLANKNPKKIWL